VVPDGCPELIVHLGDPFSRQVRGRWVVQPPAFLAGTLTRPWLLRAGRRVRTLSIRFRAGAAAEVFRFSMAEASDREVPLFRLAGPRAAARLLRSLRRARTAGTRFAAAAAWLTARLAESPPRRDGARAAVDAIRETRGQARIDDVARGLGWSRRRMQRLFERDLGISPKLYARIVRLNAVLATLDEAERGRAVDLALEAGYFDQSHLLRDFRILAGRTPRAGRAGDGEMARHFTSPERLRALLAGE
jgi:AraC-like DNA-binding protein